MDEIDKPRKHSATDSGEEWERIALQQLREMPDARVLRLECSGQKAWLKRAVPMRKNFWHRLMHLVFHLTRNSLFVPTVAVDVRDAARAEVARLRLLRRHGVPVPRVLAEGGGWFVVADRGSPVSAVLREPQRPMEERLQLIEQISMELVAMHQVGRWHGRPVLKDMVWDGDRLAFLDFEEDVGRFLSPDLCIVRDVIVYVHSLFRFLRKGNEVKLAEAGFHVLWDSTAADVRDAVVAEALKMRMLYTAGRIMRPLMGRDGVAILKTFDQVLARR